MCVTVFNALRKHSRSQILPLFDWRSYYDTGCFLRNPYYNPQPSFSSHLCHACEDIEYVAKLSASANTVQVSRYIKDHVPFVVGNEATALEISRWPLSDDFSTAYVDMVLNTIAADLNGICMFETNVHNKYADQLMTRLQKDAEVSFYAHWEYCSKKTRKAMRKLFARPSVVPMMLETTRSSWLLISSNYNAKTWKQVR